MDPWIEGIQKILERAPTGALPFSRLLEELRADGLAVEGRERWILSRISEEPGRFKLIPDRRRLGTGWRPDKESRPPVSPRLARRSPWVLSLQGILPDPGRKSPLGRLQEGLRAWGREVDEGSGIAVARWIRANEEGERLCLGLSSRWENRSP